MADTPVISYPFDGNEAPAPRNTLNAAELPTLNSTPADNEIIVDGEEIIIDGDEITED